MYHPTNFEGGRGHRGGGPDQDIGPDQEINAEGDIQRLMARGVMSTRR